MREIIVPASRDWSAVSAQQRGLSIFPPADHSSSGRLHVWGLGWGEETFSFPVEEASICGTEEFTSILGAASVLVGSSGDRSGETNAKEALGVLRHSFLTSALPAGYGLGCSVAPGTDPVARCVLPRCRWAYRPGICLYALLPRPCLAVAMHLQTPGFPKPLPTSLCLWGTGGHIAGRVFLAALARCLFLAPGRGLESWAMLSVAPGPWPACCSDSTAQLANSGSIAEAAQGVGGGQWEVGTVGEQQWSPFQRVSSLPCTGCETHPCHHAPRLRSGKGLCSEILTGMISFHVHTPNSWIVITLFRSG